MIYYYCSLQRLYLRYCYISSTLTSVLFLNFLFFHQCCKIMLSMAACMGLLHFFHLIFASRLYLQLSDLIFSSIGLELKGFSLFIACLSLLNSVFHVFFAQNMIMIFSIRFSFPFLMLTYFPTWKYPKFCPR